MPCPQAENDKKPQPRYQTEPFDPEPHEDRAPLLGALQIRRYVALLRGRGFEPADVLAGSGLRASDLAEPARRVTLTEFQAVVERALALTSDSRLGFELGVGASIADLGIVSHALMTSANLRQVIQLWCRYGASLAGMPLRLHLEERADGEWTMRVLDEWQLRPLVRACCVEQQLATGVRLGGQLAGRAFSVRSVQMSHAWPGEVQAARQSDFFGCTATYGAPHSAITMTAPGLDTALACNDAILNEVCVRHCQRILRHSVLGSPLLSHLRNLFLREPGSLPTMEQAAVSIGVSSRTLRRQLSRQQTSYQQLLNRFRFELAREYLLEGRMSAKEVGFSLGFRFTNTFHRAFRSWSGTSVGNFIRSHRSSAQHDGEFNGIAAIDTVTRPEQSR